MQKYSDIVVDRNGNAVPNVSVTVRDLNDALATLYSDDGVTPLANPTTVNSDGEYFFYAENGRYNITLSGDDITTETKTDVLLNDPEDSFPADLTDLTTRVESLETATAGIVNVLAYGAIGDGVTDDAAAIKIALAAAVGWELVFPRGYIFRAVIGAAPDGLNVQDGTTLSGGGELVLETTVAAYREFIRVQKSNVTIRDLKVRLNVPPSTSGFMFYLGNNTTPNRNIRFERLYIDGYNQDLGASSTHTVHGFGFVQEFHDATWEGCFITRMQYAMIKLNTDVETQTNIKLLGNTFKNNVLGNTACFNTPAGAVSGVVIHGNTFIRELAYYNGRQDQGLLGGTAGGTNFTITSNYMEGYCNDAMHFEEMSDSVVIANNVINLTQGNGIEVVDNNMGTGSYVTPTRYVITNNVIRTADAGVGNGVDLIWNGGTPGAENVVVSGNMIDGFEYGIYAGDTWAENTVISNNAVSNCTIGVFAVRPMHSVFGNSISHATTGLAHEFGGSWGKNHLIDCSDVLDQFRVASADRATTSGWTWRKDAQTLANGASNFAFDTFPLPHRVTGTLNVSMFHTDTTYTYARYAIEWDGSTLTVTGLFRKASGAVVSSTTASSAVTNNSGSLAVTFSNSSGSDASIYIQVEFDGLWLE